MAETVTEMVLKVNLQCTSCNKKIKKILCKFPQIRGQIYDDKQNTVTISVVCCSPEMFRDKLYCKGGNVIKCIEIKPPPKKTAKPTEDPKPPDKPPPPPARTCPCYHGLHPAPPPCYAGYYGCGYGCGCGRGCHLGRSFYYIEENPSACKIM